MEKQEISMIRLEMVKEKGVAYAGEHMRNIKEAAAFAKRVIGNADRECLLVCCTDTRMKPTCIQLAGIGSVNSCMVSIPEVFKAALLSNAAGVIVFHNHPSGDVTPSREDEQVTERIRKAGELLGIPLWDHIIIGDGEEYYSMGEEMGWQ